MSVINKMLRDLDARRSGALPELQRQGGPDLLLGTRSVGARGPAARASWRWILWLLLLAMIAAGAWLLGVLDPASPPPPAVRPIPAPPPAVVASAPAVEAASSAALPSQAPASAPQLLASTPQPAASSPLAMPAPAPAPPAVRASGPAVASGPRPARGEPVTRPQPVFPVPKVAPPLAAARASGPAASAVAPAGPAEATAGGALLAQRRQSAAQETLAQAQALWAQGNREAAVELLREAVQLAERSAPQETAVLAPLVREQARLELALGRPAAVLGLLTRLEPALSDQADLWAVRGNAAQRLGRHAEAVQAYQQALRLRPGEPRWLLGAAVSLAAQGQLDAAARQAEQARALGPVSPEVLHYLRQAGVPLP